MGAENWDLLACSTKTIYLFIYFFALIVNTILHLDGVDPISTLCDFPQHMLPIPTLASRNLYKLRGMQSATNCEQVCKFCAPDSSQELQTAQQEINPADTTHNLEVRSSTGHISYIANV